MSGTNDKTMAEIRHSADNINISAPDSADGASEISLRNAENIEMSNDENSDIDTSLDLRWLAVEIGLFILCIVLLVFAIQAYNACSYQRFYEKILAHKSSVTAEVTAVMSFRLSVRDHGLPAVAF